MGVKLHAVYNVNDYYGKVSTSWGLGLNNFLDPDNTGQNTLDGIDQIDLPNPLLSVSASQFNIELGMNEWQTESFTISNIGEDESELNFYLTTSPYETIGAGPDGGNYFWTHSTIDENTNYEWITIPTIGTLYNFSNNDVAGEWVNLEFSFPFYGTNYTQLIINPNGWVGFDNDNDSWENTNIPSNSISGAAIFALWDDLNPENDNCNEYCSGEVYTHSNAERTVIWFDDVAHWWNNFENATYNFQIVLYPNGEISMNYNSLNGEYTASVGVQGNSSTGIVYAYDNEILSNNFTLKFNKGPEWLELSSTSGTILEGFTSNINFTSDAVNLAVGEYHSFINIQSNGGDRSTSD